MRALFPSVVVSCAIFLAPCAHGNTLQPGPAGSAPTDKSFFLTFSRDGSADARSYIVDRKGFYERDGWSRSDSSRIGAFNDDEGSRNKGFSSSLSFNGFNSKGSSAGIGGSFPGGPGFSGGAGNGGGGSLSGGGGFFNMKDLGEFGGLSGSNRGSDLGGPSGSFGFGSEGGSGKGLWDPSGVSATPLPASWTMMLIGLAFGLLVWFGKSNFPQHEKRKRPAVA